MKVKLITIISLIFLFTSCQKLERNNPFDPECSLNMWTPENFQAVQEGSTVKLTWNQPSNNISGFKLSKQIESGTSIDLQSQTPSSSQYVDASLIGGKMHTYTITAYAGSNQSNTVTTQIIPILTAGISTTAVNAVSSSTAQSGGIISTDGGAPITARGVCWNTSPNPTINNSKSSDGTGSGSFTCILSSLNPGIIYYIRAYATNIAGTIYGNEITFTLPTLPTVSTGAISSLTSTTASSGGIIISAGGGTVTSRGVCWNTTPTPSIINNKTNDGLGIGSFNSVISGLIPGVTYYLRAYATNSTGIAYGNELSFTALPDLPIVSTAAISYIAQTTASGGGNVTSANGATVTVRGVCWSSSKGPTILNGKTINGSGTGSFTSTITGLMAGMTYYLRAYATNSVGTAYGNEVTFITPTSITDVDGNVYSTVTIGTQVWMASNLKVTRYNDQTTIPLVTNDLTWTNLTSPGYCWYNNDASTNKNTYGALYNWYTVKTGKVCPVGWHVPTNAEWNTLIVYLGVNVSAGKLKEAGTAHWLSPNTGATNETGFTAVPGGLRVVGSSYAAFLSIGSQGFWWASTGITSEGAVQEMSYDYGNVFSGNFIKGNGYSVRCLKD